MLETILQINNNQNGYSIPKSKISSKICGIVKIKKTTIVINILVDNSNIIFVLINQR